MRPAERPRPVGRGTGRRAGGHRPPGAGAAGDRVDGDRPQSRQIEQQGAVGRRVPRDFVSAAAHRYGQPVPL
ncbi:hypothetical protein, partial [Nocardia abscessus]|uniref:hypothetical protein n=1 Tax=Nocardia abscessus TaxID=120957 RepID=UPI0024560E2C